MHVALLQGGDERSASTPRYALVNENSSNILYVYSKMYNKHFDQEPIICYCL
jgi:hypothetical protein